MLHKVTRQLGHCAFLWLDQCAILRQYWSKVADVLYVDNYVGWKTCDWRIYAQFSWLTSSWYEHPKGLHALALTHRASGFTLAAEGTDLQSADPEGVHGILAGLTRQAFCAQPRPFFPESVKIYRHREWMIASAGQIVALWALFCLLGSILCRRRDPWGSRIKSLD
eukprot:scaffold5895_cov17-Prasinocladus_malaysianus.AAC.1